MEDLTIPGWAIVLMPTIVTGIVYWLVWLTKKMHENDLSIALNNANDENVKKELASLNEKIDRMDVKIDSIMKFIYSSGKSI